MRLHQHESQEAVFMYWRELSFQKVLSELSFQHMVLLILSSAPVGSFIFVLFNIHVPNASCQEFIIRTLSIWSCNVTFPAFDRYCPLLGMLACSQPGRDSPLKLLCLDVAL